MSFIRRNYPRIPLNLPVTIIINDKPQNNAICKNISMGGMCITVEDTVEREQNGRVEFLYHCEDGEEIAFKGEFTVKWLHEMGNDCKEFGIQFTYYDPSNLTKLARIVLNQMTVTQVCT